MGNVVLLAQRLPYPPNKGDKVRSYHLLEHLRLQHRVYLGTFIDDPDDERHLGALQERCADVHAVRLNRWRARGRCVAALGSRTPLTVSYFHDGSLTRWVKRVAAEQSVDAVIVFSSSMVPYALALRRVPMLIDFVDVDSDKWAQYAKQHRWPMSWIYGREARALGELEAAAALQAQRSFLVSQQEVELFARRTPAARGRVEVLRNGVDADFFDPERSFANPYRTDETPVVFTGTMDHWPNVDAVLWFARRVLPRLRARWPALRLHVVGRRPSRRLQAIAGPAVNITGAVDDIRPYIKHASVVIAPMRISRGVQNKILEAMAMARPVVAASACVAAIEARPGVEVMAADSTDGYVASVNSLLEERERAQAVGRAGRRRVERDFRWPEQFAPLDRQLAALRSMGART